MTLFQKLAFSFVVITASASLAADWLDDIVYTAAAKKEFIVADAIDIVNGYKTKADERVDRLEKAYKANHSGFWAMVHAGSYAVELQAAKGDKSYYNKVAQVLKELPDNKKQREKFAHGLENLQHTQQEIKVLKASFRAQKNKTEQFKLGLKIAAKNAELSAKKAYIKSTIFFS